MKLSDEQFIRVSTLSPVERENFLVERENFLAVSGQGETRPEEARRIATELLASEDEVDPLREEIVASLRERIESGAYIVSGEQVAEMLVRRMYADNLH
jgi:anti-sigma28 factor (negative regulator of flagellin synthesis)